MFQRRIFAAVALLCALVAPAHAQKTKAQIISEITSLFPDNVVGAITPLALRTVSNDLAISIMPTAPVVSGNLACFNGTTGLLQDCGTGPSSSGIIYIAPYTGGVSQTQSAYNAQRISVLDFGAKGDTVTLFDGAINSTSTAFTSAAATFSFADIGKVIRILGAGTAGGLLETTISGFTSANAVTTTAPAATTVTGAKAFYGSDDTLAIQAAVNTMAVGASPRARGCIDLPNRVFITTAAISVPAFTNVCISGAGASLISDSLGSVIQPSITTDGIVVNSTDPVVFENFGIFYPSAAGNSTACVTFNPPAGSLNYNSSIRHVLCNNSYNGLNTQRLVHAVIDGVEIFDFSNAAIVMQNTLSSAGLVGDAGDNRIVNSSFLGKASIASACVYWSGGGGLTVQNNKCTLAVLGVQINPSANVTTSQINIQGNSFDGMTQAAVFFLRQDGTSAINQIIVSGNTCNLFAATAASCISAPVDPSGIGLKNLIGSNNTVYGPAAANTMFSINTVDNVLLSNNAMQSNNASTTGITIGSTVTNGVIGPQTFTGTFAVDWSNASASYKVSNAVTPSAGGLVYSTADRTAVLAGVAAAGRMAQSGNLASPTWSTASWPSTTTINQLLYSSSANAVAGLATANSSVLVTSAGGVPSLSTTLPNVAHGTPTSITLTSGTGLPLTTGVTGTLPVANGGTGVTTAAGEIARTQVGFIMATPASSVNFNSANTDTAITILLPTGYTRFIVNRVIISHASASLTTSTVGVFSATGGGGVALQSLTANTVSTASDATANNAQNIASGVTNVSFVGASLATPNTIYFRVGTPQGSAATADVTVFYHAIP